MARVVTLKDRVRAIIRKYKHVNNRRFLFNKKEELKRSYQEITVWLLIHDEERGYSIFPFNVRRAVALSVADWTKLFKSPVGKYKPLYEMFTQKLLPAINNKGGNAWKFKALLCWTGAVAFQDKQRAAGSRFVAPDAIPEPKNTHRSKPRNHAAKKRNATARNRRRGRQ